ncbi:MAG TPA: RidA family protein [Polyangiales bacterium]|nr:RidA family protein [Polyangiales bacterium]
MSKRAISSEDAPKAVGPYSQAIVAGGFVFTSGQIPLDPRTGKLIESADVADHVRRVLDNLTAVVTAAGSSLERAVKVTIYLANMADFAEVNRAYAAYFPGTPPARSTVQVAALPANARVEIELVALA